MTEIIFKVVELIKAYNSKDKEARKVCFDAYLEPAIQDVNIIHRNYLDTFLKYLDLIRNYESDDLSNHPVFQMIYIDSISSSDIREKLYSFYDNTNDKALNGFVTSIGVYFRFLGESFTDKIDDEELQNFLVSNALRYELYFALEVIFKRRSGSNAQKKERANKRVEDSINILQKNYRAVLDSYNQVKKELLS